MSLPVRMGLFYAALLRTVPSQRLAAAFSLSLVLFYWFGCEIHHSVSHSLALLAASLALFLAALAYAERPTAMRAFLLGLIIGIGLMAKWSFLLMVAGLGVALAVTGETRRIYRDPRTLRAARQCPCQHARRGHQAVRGLMMLVDAQHVEAELIAKLEFV